MKKFASWLDKHYIWIVLVAILLLCIYNILLHIAHNELKEEYAQLKEEITKVEQERDANWDLVIERNNEIYLLEMECEEWKELFYAQIDFHPYEGPDW